MRFSRESSIAWAAGALMVFVLLGIVYGIYTVTVVHSIAQQTQTLLTSGKTTAAQNAAAAKIDAAKGEMIIAHVELQLNEAIAAAVHNEHALCTIAQHDPHLTAAIVAVICNQTKEGNP